MKFEASEFHIYYQPSRCERRVYLKHKGLPEAPLDPYAEVLKKLGVRHERTHLSTFPQFVDLSDVPEREQKTREAISKNAPVIYQGRLKAVLEEDGMRCDVVGEPDFLILTPSGYTIRDSKMARRITPEDHPEILSQLRLYGWLFEQTFKQAPSALEVHGGTGEIVQVPPVDGKITEEVKRIIATKLSAVEPYSAVGWSRCGGCAFKDHCWKKAQDDRDVAQLPSVDKNLAIALRDSGIKSFDEVLVKCNEADLAEFKRPWGTRMQKVGKKAASILREASALQSGKEIVISKPALPQHHAYVMFDLEGMPPQLQDLDKIYLWGLQVFGDKRGPYDPAVAGFGEDGEKDGWMDFLRRSEAIFQAFGDIPFVHWSHYEKTAVARYIGRFGDHDGIAARVQRNLLDLLPIAKESLALPLPSFSLKVIEKHIGFKRTQDEYGGQWSMAKYIEATETEDQKLRDSVMSEILLYNKEDLESMWAIFEWLRSRTL